MKKLTKLDEKKISSLESVKGGLMQMQMEFSDSENPTTTHTPTQRGDQYFCDHSGDAR